MNTVGSTWAINRLVREVFAPIGPELPFVRVGDYSAK
jgi:hypothetical protein